MKDWQPDKKWTLFLDRDGVVNRKIDHDYVRNPDQFVWMPGIFRTLRYLQQIFGRIVVVTNQQGVAKGLMSEADLIEVMEYMKAGLAEQEIEIAGYYFCPHFADAGCDCRKPRTGMGLQAQADFAEIDFDRSLMVGDSISDMHFGRGLGMKTVYLHNHRSYEAPEGLIDIVVPTLLQLMQGMEQS